MTAEIPPANTLPKATMTDVKIHYLTITLEQTLDDNDHVRWTATEQGVDLTGEGRTAPEAIANYAEVVGDFEPRRPNAQVVDPEEVSGE